MSEDWQFILALVCVPVGLWVIMAVVLILDETCKAIRRKLEGEKDEHKD